MVVVLLGACGDDADGDDASGNGSEESDEIGPDDAVRLEGDAVRVIAQDNTFVDDIILIDAGATVTWENVGRQTHDVLPGHGGSGWGVEEGSFQPGDRYEHTFDEPGVYRYYCSLHGNEDVGMTGAVVVE